MSVLSVTTILVALFAICEISAVKINSPGYQCTPGSSFKDEDGCNDCHCSADGKTAACTYKLCSKQHKREILNPGDPNYECEPEQEFNWECNKCRCSKTGKGAACTRRFCPPGPPKNKRAVKVPMNSPGYTCVPDSTFKDDAGCNDCRCSSDGKRAACTFKLCVNKREALTPSDVNYPCEPDQEFKWNCNDCRCSKTGKGAACTKRACSDASPQLYVSRPERSTVAKPGEPGYCSPGKSFPSPDGCNTCTCSENGKNAVCTLRACIHKRETRPQRSTVAKPGEPGYCTPGKSFPSPDGCNTCTCSENGKNAACTLRACIHKRETKPIAIGEPGYTCTPHESFLDSEGCNMCTCDADGINVMCTDKTCPKRNRRQVDIDDKNCTPGDIKKDDCNTCRCIKGRGYACTKMACPKTKRETDDKNCTPGDVIMRDCNSCTCVKDLGYACTKKGCLTKQGIQKREESVEKEFNGTPCAPNDEFVIDCNTCYCNSDGSGYSCTEKPCTHVTLPKQR